MIAINQDIQACHQILQLLQFSKSRADLVLDLLPEIFAVMNEEGEIFKGNHEIAKLLKIEHQELLGSSLSGLFFDETWKIFLSHFKKMVAENLDRVEFELSVDRDLPEDRPHFWIISRFAAGADENSHLFSVIGNDLTELRRAERQLSEIFASIPLGIFTVGESGRIEGRYSAYSETLLNNKELIGQNFIEMLFRAGWNDLSEAQREGLNNLLGIFGRESMFYDVVRSGFPKELFFPIAGHGPAGGRHLGINYQPIVYNGKVLRLLVILEDRTELVLAKLAEQRAGLVAEKTVARIIQFKKCPTEILPLSMDETAKLFQRLPAMLEAKDQRGLTNTLHGIKGNARVSGFVFLTEMAHHLESKLLSHNDVVKKLDWEATAPEIAELSAEWDELQGLYRALNLSGEPKTESAPVANGADRGHNQEKTETIRKLFEAYNRQLRDGPSLASALLAERIRIALLYLTCLPVSELEPIIRMRVSETAKKLGKSVEVKFHWENVLVDEACKASLSEILLHILNNAVAHGLEDPAERAAVGKKNPGTIEITVREDLGVLLCEVTDDGRGVNIEKVKDRALKNRLISLSEALQAPRHQLMQLIFQAGFSTADTVDEISGRGVGLDAVVSSLAEFDGRIEVRDNTPCGTRFVFQMASAKRTPVQRICMPTHDFLEATTRILTSMEDEQGPRVAKLEVTEQIQHSRGVLFIDTQRLHLAITTSLTHFFKNSPVRIRLDLTRFGKVIMEAFQERTGNEARLRPVSAEYELAFVACENYIKQHDGAVFFEDGRLEISFGFLLKRNQVPMVRVAPHNGMQALSNDTIGRIQEVADDLNLEVLVIPPDRLHEAPDTTLTLHLGNDPTGNPQHIPLGASRKVIKKQLLAFIEYLLGEKKGAVDRGQDIAS